VTENSQELTSIRVKYEYKHILVQELTEKLEKKGAELLRYKKALAEILTMSVVYAGIEEMEQITKFVTDFIEGEQKK
jgi:phosphopantothenoylcysteine synthetase/decarboxylase